MPLAIRRPCRRRRPAKLAAPGDVSRRTGDGAAWIRCRSISRPISRRAARRRCHARDTDVVASDPDHSEAVGHLRGADPVLAAIIDQVGPCMLGSSTDRGGPAHDHYGALLRAIVGQQLSVSAARSIYRRLIDRYGGRTPPPAQRLADGPDEMRAAAGLSRSKVVFLRDLAERVGSGELVLEDLDELPDEDVAAKLIEVKGIGQWTVDMFL